MDISNEEPQLYIEYRGDTPFRYIYGTEADAARMWFDDAGYPTPEEARKAWEEENKCR